MSSHSFSSLKDLLKEQPPIPKLTFDDSPSYSKKKETGYEPTTLSEEPYVTEMFGELYFRETPNGISMTQLFPSIQTNQPSFQTMTGNTCKKVSEREEISPPVTENACVYPNIWGKVEGKLFPSPISCLKSLKVGKPFVYYRYDYNLGRFVEEVINVIPHGVMCTSREKGRIIMNPADGFLVDVKDETEDGSDKE